MRPSIRAIQFLIAGFVLTLSTTQAQEVQHGDSSSMSITRTNGFYLAPSYFSNQLVDTWASFVGIQGGAFIGNHIDIGISYHRNIDNFSRQIIFPSTYIYDQSNVGLHVQYHFLDTRIRPIAGFGINGSTIEWSSESNDMDKFKEMIWILDISTGVSWSISDLLLLQANIGYNFADEIALIGFNSSDFNGLKVGLNLKFRLFYF